MSPCQTSKGNQFLTLIWRSLLLFLSAMIGLVAQSLLEALLAGTPFRIGDAAIGIGGFALLVACIPCYLITSNLFVRFAKSSSIDTWHILVVGFFQGFFLLRVFVAVGEITKSITEGPWGAAYFFTIVAVTVILACALPALVLAVVVRIFKSAQHASPG